MDHIPVMLKEAMALLSPKNGGIYIDGTFGAGGYSRSILENGALKVIAIDRDPSVQKYADILVKEYPGKIELHTMNFADCNTILNGATVDGIVLDLGVSSMQLDQRERGFSFMRDSSLDMRMSSSGKTAADFINSTNEDEIAKVIYEYGDERASRKIAKFIIEERKISSITTTTRLAEIVRRAVGHRNSKIDTATKTFQAIRIWVNDEMGALEKFLANAEHLLNANGKLVIITFHSLEDRIVKRYIQEKTDKKVARSKYSTKEIVSSSPYKLIVKKALKPTDEEISHNYRARSAKLRAVIKTGESYDK